MAEVWGAILRGLGQVLAFLYDVIPVYGIAIILLTLLVRVVLLPLAVKQTRSMQEMSRLQPQLKALQKKYKGDRQKLQEETMKLYREHGVNPLGGCLPLILQLPVFFALFSVLRAATPAVAVPAEPAEVGALEDGAFCAPARGPEGADEIVCQLEGGGTQTFRIAGWEDAEGGETPPPPWVTGTEKRFDCSVQGEGVNARFRCDSPVGTGHLPDDSDLYHAILEDDAKFVGMHLSCSATQATSTERIRECAPVGSRGGGAPLVAYYGMIVLMAGTTFYQTRQMQQSAGQQQQMQMIGRIMPLFLAFISLSIPAGVLVYWVTTNVWQIGQQGFMLRRRAEAEERPKPEKPRPTDTPDLPETPERPGPRGAAGGGAGRGTGGGPSGGRRRGGRRARGRKKRRKR